jgi:polar amino acid transport system substrate-binding protein
LATQADQMPRAPLARLLAVFWMFVSVVFIAYFTASVTSSLTLQRMRGDINGPEDLPGRRVATVRDSTSSEWVGRVQPAGPIFHRENYGIAFRPDSPHRRPVNEALLRMKESGAYDQLYRKWFGSSVQ